jgi:hypothetical protein
MNLVMVAPLYDKYGDLRYFLGAQIDVTGLCKDCTELDGLRRLIEKRKLAQQEEQTSVDSSSTVGEATSHNELLGGPHVDEFQSLSEMFNDLEIDVVRRHGGRMNPAQAEEDEESFAPHRPGTRLDNHPNGESERSNVSSAVYKLSRNSSLAVFQNVRAAHHFFSSPAPGVFPVLTNA